MKGVIWSTKTKDRLLVLEEDEGRMPWERPQLKDLFSTRIYQEPLEDVGDPLFWAPLIAVFTGLREEEALQLPTADIREIDGVAVFDLRKGAGKRFKTDASIRMVPVPGALIKLGFLELVRMRQDQGEMRLFPHIKRHEQRKTFSANFTKEFGNYRRKEKIYDPQRDFHALRTTFNVELIKKRVDTTVRKYLMGHAINDVNWEHYSGEGFPLDHLRDVVDLIDIDVSMIRPPFEHTPVAIDLDPNEPKLRVIN